MRSPYLLSVPIALSCITAMLATDLYLPAVPDLYRTLGGAPSDGQYTLASCIAGFSAGQLFVGPLGDRYSKRKIMIVSLMIFAGASLLCALADTMGMLIALRGVQGFASAAGVALAPAMVRELGDDQTTVKLIGFINSIQAVVPALAPAAGVWLVAAYGWKATFFMISAAALLVAFVFALMPSRPSPHPGKLDSPLVTYMKLLTSRRFIAYTLGHGFGIGALMTFIFAAPYLMTNLFGRDMDSFVWMQAFLIGSFIISSNLGAPFVKRVGMPTAIVCGSLVQLGGGLALLGLVALNPAPSTAMLVMAMIPVNVGLGLRAGATFASAMSHANGPPGSTGALMIFIVSLVMSIGTAIVAPFLHLGAWTVGFAVVAQLVLSLAALIYAVGPGVLVRPQPKPAVQSA
ncbi:MAG: MFS transporter [Rhodospirillaceae bacterium]|nr:MFS transporter [Rhodospirillaceae bacterium]